MSLPLPPASTLHSILLVTKSRSLGPRLVFHYPPLSPSATALAADQAPAWFGYGTSTGSLDGSHDDSSDWDSSTDNDDDIEVGSRTSGGKGSGRTSYRDKDKHSRPGVGIWGRQESIDEEDVEEHVEGKSDKEGKGQGGDYDWNTVLGFKIDALEKLLCPSKAFNKRRFELGVEGIVFVGAPMFVRDDGFWKKPRRRKDRPKEKADESVANNNIQDSDGDGSGIPSTEASFVYPEGFEPGYGHGLMSGAVSEAGSDTRSNSTTGNVPDMTMFNIVFVLNPPALEYQLRVKEMYDNVTRKFAKVLKYEQARYHYVWSESKRIIDIKQRAKEMGESLSVTWQQIVNTSPLAKWIAILFDAIASNKIAHIHFDRSFSTSFQIPQADSTPYLPNALEPQMPGLWLTTSNVVTEDDDGTPLTQHSALLLLEDAETLIKDLESDSRGSTAPLAFYIRNIVPTKSLQKISIKHNILAQDMEYVASHLVFWRRARLIPPLHPRDTYIVSPNADMSALHAAIPAYAARFPTLPSLPKILSLLSGTPKPYRFFIPTNEHRERYMEILAWLMRGGWVTQLRTFAWVRPNDAGSTSSNRTTIPLHRPSSPSPLPQGKPHHRPSPLHLKPSEEATRSPLSPTHNVFSPALPSPPPHTTTHAGFAPSIVLSPQKANALESRWLEKIGATFEDSEVRDFWPKLLRHLDGKHAVEDVGAQEGVKRGVVWRVWGAVREGGWLVVVRHW
ncbi:hypothetical protein EJ04DRAFT_491990 [Polyplosphaeria fusca]|uniref:Nitrogen permease regulator 3 n=1 Tax=Polyplosphaeria fusca TaxID=682080 RepID=A0A9P4QWX1_9PLEO|nr:hypothetical protein EJ04DRAFT_491990 [Polyplosphaeria fusca]